MGYPYFLTQKEAKIVRRERCEQESSTLFHSFIFYIYKMMPFYFFYIKVPPHAICCIISIDERLSKWMHSPKWGEYLISFSSFDQKKIFQLQLGTFSIFVERWIRSGCKNSCIFQAVFLFFYFFIPHDRMTKSLINHDSISFFYIPLLKVQAEADREL